MIPDEIKTILEKYMLLIGFMLFLIIAGAVSVCILGRDNPVEQEIESIVEYEIEKNKPR